MMLSASLLLTLFSVTKIVLLRNHEYQITSNTQDNLLLMGKGKETLKMSSLRRALVKDIPAITKLFVHGLGEKHSNGGILPEIIEDGACYLAEINGTLIGAGTTFITSNVTDLFPIGQKHLALELPLIEPVGIMKTIVVHESARNQGIGLLLIEACLAWMHENGAKSAFTESWISSNKEAGSRKVLISAGFLEIMTVPHFWKQESIVSKYKCPSCGNPCQCSAVLLSQSLALPS
jgi:GNAT superfamily N-acetyltransferase